MTRTTRERRCIDCVYPPLPGRRPRPAPFPGPRCATHHREKKQLTKARAHDQRTTKVYRGIAPGDYEKIWKEQGEKDPICLRRGSRARKKFPLEHDHRLNWPRGITCSICNHFLAWIADDPEAGMRLAEYLHSPPAWRVVGPPPEQAPLPFEEETS